MTPGDTVVTVGVDRLEEGGKVIAEVPGEKPTGKRSPGEFGGGKPGGGKPGGGRPHKAAS
jgi:hypothetical protein